MANRPYKMIKRFVDDLSEEVKDTMEGGGSGGSDLLVTLTDGENDYFTQDKTNKEIAVAFANDHAVNFTYDGTYGHMEGQLINAKIASSPKYEFGVDTTTASIDSSYIDFDSSVQKFMYVNEK